MCEWMDERAICWKNGWTNGWIEMTVQTKLICLLLIPPMSNPITGLFVSLPYVVTA